MLHSLQKKFQMKNKIALYTFLFSLAFLFSFHPVSAQTNTQDVIYLKDGSIYRGQISGTTTDGSIKLLTHDNNLIVFNKSQIDSMKQESFKGKNYSTLNIKSKGVFSITSVGLMAGENGTGGLFETVNGYRFNHFLAIGGGVGIEYSDVVLMPLYFSLRSDLFSGKATPFIHADCGYNFMVGQRNNNYYFYYEDPDLTTNHGGLNVGAGVGVKINTRGDFAFMISWAYKFEQWTRDYDYMDTHNHYDYEYQRMVLKVGLEF